MEKLKLLFITHTHSSGGGAEKVLTTLVNNLDRDRYDISIFELLHYDIKNEPLLPHIKLLTPMVTVQQTRIPFYEYTLNQLLMCEPTVVKTLYHFEEYDIVISWIKDTPSYLASCFCNYKIAWTHSDIRYLLNLNNFPDITFEKQLQEKIWTIPEKIFSVSAIAVDSIIKVFSQFKHKTEIFYNPIDIKAVKKLAEEKIETHIFSNSKTLIGIGRLDSNKNFSLLLETQKVLKDNHVDTHLIILGIGEEEKILKKKAAALGIQDSVLFLGFQENPYPYVKAADLLCVSSFTEAFPTVVCEAMILGKPFVTTRVAGASDELACDGACGFVSDWDANDFAEKIERILSDDILYNKMSENCLKKIAEFSIDKAIKKFDYEIMKVIENKNGKKIKNNEITFVQAKQKFSHYYIFLPIGYNIKIQKAFFRWKNTPTPINFLKLGYRILNICGYIVTIPVRLVLLPTLCRIYRDKQCSK
ncbi:glycosyltransferase [Treponema denticola]|uniref:glycosyltransferase n=1 Tax=Treponema denticola TaxID=158 RepID=UPI002102408F|nr:glycosyltransferase [Treponema denticola]UTY25868.1 glycosyltransferase [Treponema denticola]